MTRLEKFELLEEIGRGSFGDIYRAMDMSLDREVVLKILHAPLATDPYSGQY